MLENFDRVRIGTRLKLRDDLEDGCDYNNVICTPSMVTHNGEIVVVTEFCSYPGYSTDCVHVGTSEDVNTTFRHRTEVWKWVWSPPMFDCIVDGEIQDVSLFDMLSGGEDSA